MCSHKSIFLKQTFSSVMMILIFVTLNCDPLVERFEDVENAIWYAAKKQTTPPSNADTIMVMSWNIRFGIGRAPWFGDSCGDQVIYSEDEVLINLRGIADKINELQPDILLLQEVDVQSKKSGYVDELQWLLDHTYFNYGVYASYWQVQFVPSDGLGRINMGNAILSRWKISEAVRIPLPLRGDQDALTKYFYLRHNILKTKIDLPGVDNFYAVNVHIEAFSTDDTKKIQVDLFKDELDKLAGSGKAFVAGGDLNLLPPGSDSTDYCDEDKCPGESFHGPNDHPQHKEGSNYTPEMTWLQGLYDSYQCSVPLAEYLKDQRRYFTHTTNPNSFWDRKLDYLFTNYKWVPGSEVTHQDILDLSDHAPVSARWEVPK
ncbi:MAG: endonuclease/exonuclease/phosphatase family protein [candidate division KSB1 bacterium]|nr:endonuclease/exonuclease/phosphatase family protein [candidate division KSB1 bacterium]MDZ7319391.1 endonuclease/exonuclease/phosphatase family protein [candidate division KSB1 bacterium]MDZ7342259.1 endonuclease/exonuclease/phosphatase family protein [candidate division KSB1 bacterium]